VTSRRSAWDSDLGVWTLLLGVFSRNESSKLLRKHCPDRGIDAGDLTAIAAELDDLPLALHLAGRYLARYHADISPAEYVRALRSPSILDHPSLQSGGISPTGHDQHVARTFALSYERLNGAVLTDHYAQALLARAAYFAPGEPIPSDLLLATLDRPAGDHSAQAADALARLVELGLIEPVGHAGDFVRMHRLIEAFVHQIDDDPQAQADVERVMLAVAERLNATEDVARLLPMQRHLHAVTDAALPRRDARAADLSYQLSLHLEDIEDLTAAQRYNEVSLDIRAQLFGDAHPAIVPNLHHQGWILDWQTLDAKPYHERALAIRKAALGDDHPDTAESFNYMGTMQRS
jgi:hypothetical protein